MLARIFMYASAWFALSVIVGLLVGRAISTFSEEPAPGLHQASETNWGTGAIHEVDEEKEMPVPAHAEMQEVA